MHHSFSPRVSIVIPVYNGAAYLREAVDSALAQTYANTEVIVVNDGSCDGGATRAIALSYGERITYLEKENGGVSSALNHGIRHMTGDYFSWLSHDDKYEPNKVANGVRWLASFEERDSLIAFCDSYCINEHSEPLYSVTVPLEKGAVHSGREVLRSVFAHDMLNVCCMLIPRTAFDVCGYFDEDLRYNQDALMLYRLFSGGYRLAFQPDCRDVMYRLHATQTSKTRRDLLLRDSLEVAKTMALPLARQSDKEIPLLRMFARRHAEHACKDAVLECVRVGEETGVFHRGDVWYLRLWLWIGRGRNLLKAVRLKVLFRA